MSASWAAARALAAAALFALAFLIDPLGAALVLWIVAGADFSASHA
jgi:hypothetical protein